MFYDYIMQSHCYHYFMDRSCCLTLSVVVESDFDLGLNVLHQILEHPLEPVRVHLALVTAGQRADGAQAVQVQISILE